MIPENISTIPTMLTVVKIIKTTIHVSSCVFPVCAVLHDSRTCRDSKSNLKPIRLEPNLQCLLALLDAPLLRCSPSIKKPELKTIIKRLASTAKSNLNWTVQSPKVRCSPSIQVSKLETIIKQVPISKSNIKSTSQSPIYIVSSK